MRKQLAFALLSLGLLIAFVGPGGMWAKFGISKTRVTFSMRHPPAFVTPGREIRVEASAVDPRHAFLANQSKGLLQQRLLSEDYKPAPAAQTVLTFSINHAEASVRHEKRVSAINLHTGTHTEYDKKGNATQVEDCKYGEQAEITFLVSEGKLAASLSVTDAKTQASLFSQAFNPGYNAESQIAGPQQCGGVAYGVQAGQLQNPDAIHGSLVEKIVADTVKLVAGYDEPRTVLLAVDKELKPGNAAALAHDWEQALAAWKQASISKGEIEAARQYNVGVAHEAVAAAAMRRGAFDEATSHLAEAEKCYQQALNSDPKEKYFRDTLSRLHHDRQVLQSEQAHEFMKQASEMSSVPLAAPPGAPATVNIPMDGWPEEKEAVHNFRMYVRTRVTAQKSGASEAFQEGLKADANDYGVAPAVAVGVIDSEVNRFQLVQQNQEKYRQLLQDVAKEGVISKDVRQVLVSRQKSLRLSDAQVKEVEAQLHCREE